MKRTTTLPKNATALSGRVPYLVSGAVGQLSADADRLAVESADRHIAGLLNDGARAHATSSAAGMCTVWPGVCADTELGHYDHSNHDHEVLDKSGGRLLDIAFVQFSDERLGASEPVVCIGEEDFAPEEIRPKTAELRRLLDVADALADKVMASNEPVTPAEPRTWTYTRQGDRATVSVTCTPWCENSHEMDQYLTAAPSDIYHQAWGQERTIEATEEFEKYEPRRLLSAQLGVIPDSELGEAERVPHVKVEVVDGLWTRPMGPDALAAFIGTVEGQLAELKKLQTRLVQVRAEAGE
ncbi:DUF6907 domain-containing protein [Streptomyces liliifuscus]|uniref:Uncharacterized protein n=1 Tax=Streptomyces liliifuscus TaxID=2797636 RepID=A0A7T7I888_9ACTN|nr:hypothetical protein [Streptomyces liliifuscus]QQM42826.1 hypothetical protein JEQ17_27650 [Streptomyces liliifuscus]